MKRRRNGGVGAPPFPMYVAEQTVALQIVTLNLPAEKKTAESIQAAMRFSGGI